MKDTTVLPVLTGHGLPADADVAYRALALFGPCDLAELVRRVGLSRPRLRAALSALADVGIAMQIAEPATGRRRAHATARWAVMPPELVVDKLREQYGRRHARASVTDLMNAARSCPGVRVVPQATATERRSYLLDQARHEHLVMYTDLAFDTEVARGAVPSARRRHERGVRLRTLALADSRSPRLPAPDLALLDGEHRRAGDLPFHVAIIDRSVAFLPLDDDDAAAGCLEVTHPRLVNGLCALYERQWATATRPLIPTARQHALLGLLAKGHTDVSAAQRLGVSARTIAHEVRALMDHYRVTSRFQLGLVLAITWDDLDIPPQGDQTLHG
ncbi:hypothetical protein [Streptosporangium roseum]|uniref:hypothetical protein n=1 Tax=Streptosporangium roseum TaxID=2001 RepID=UPI00331B35B4